MNMISKIYFFVIGPFSERDYKRFGIDTLVKNGFDVEVWDFAPFLCMKAHKEVKVMDPINYSRLRLFKNREEVLNAISGLSKVDSFIVCLIPYNIDTYIIYRTISKNKIKYGVFLANVMPFSTFRSYAQRDLMKHVTMKEIMDKLSRITFKKIAEAVFLRVNFRFLKISPATLNLAGGERSILHGKYPINKETETLWIHTLDYNIYLTEKEKPGSVEKDLVVFLDEYLPFHPDYIYSGSKPFVTPDNYYSALCKIFTYLENEYNLRIVIAAHPRSDYERHHDYFQGRPVIRGKTVELVKRASCVLAHSSTSINYAVLFKKPIIFITTDEIEKSSEGIWIGRLAPLLGKRVYNLNNIKEIDISYESKINDDLYEKYRNDYIKKAGSEELEFWQVFANKMKNI